MHGRVESIEWLTPSYVRVVLNGDGLAEYAPVPYADSYVNVAIPPAESSYEAPFALDDLKELPREQRPFRRRITVRRWNQDTRRLTLEFVTHGDEGAAGPWAARAQAGDALVFTGPAGAYNPDPAADWHLMVGDESALPAIAASVEAVPPGVPVVVRLICDGPEYEIALTSPGDLDLAWVHRPDPLAGRCGRAGVPGGPGARVRTRRGRGDPGPPPAPAGRPRPGRRAAVVLALLEAGADGRGLARDQGGLERRNRA